MAVAKAKGRLRGKQPKLSPAQERHLVELHRAGAHTGAELAELFNVARSTVYRAVGRAGVPPTDTAVGSATSTDAGDEAVSLEVSEPGHASAVAPPAVGRRQAAPAGVSGPQARPARGAAPRRTGEDKPPTAAAPIDAPAARRRLGVLRGGIRDLSEDWASTEQLARHLHAQQADTGASSDTVASALRQLEESLRGSTPVPVGVARTTDPTELRKLLREAERNYDRLIRDHLTRAREILTADRS